MCISNVIQFESCDMVLNFVLCNITLMLCVVYTFFTDVQYLSIGFLQSTSAHQVEHLLLSKQDEGARASATDMQENVNSSKLSGFGKATQITLNFQQES